MKKAKTFQIHIPNPCDEKWANMTPSKGGRHCERCEKTIVDFTNKTDREIAHLHKQSNGKLCGRFTPDQLKRDIILHPKSPSRNRSKAAAALLAGMLSTGTAVAQGAVTIQRTEQHISEKENENKEKTTSGSRVISGQVTDENGEPLPFANVFIKDACTGTTTDIDGYYSIKVPENANILVVSYTGYPDVETALTQGQNNVLNVVMKDARLLLGDVCIVGNSGSNDYSYFQDPPRGRTLPQLIGSWLYNNVTRKRRWRKSQTHQKATSAKTETPIIENENSHIRPPQIITKKLITNIFPNPFNNKIHITLESEAVETLRLVVYDAMSREIHTEQINVFAGTNEIHLDLNDKQLTNGSYFVSIFRENEVIQTEILMRTE